MDRIKRDEMFLAMAFVTSLRGTCNRLQVGSIIVKDNHVVSTGYNGTPPKVPHCQHEFDEPCSAAVHSEANAIAFAARAGIKTEGATIYITSSPCNECAKLIISSGISRVVYLYDYRDIKPLELLHQAGVKVDTFDSVDPVFRVLEEAWKIQYNPGGKPR